MNLNEESLFVAPKTPHKYFAYGSCMSDIDILRTTPSAKLSSTAILKDFALHFPLFAPGRKGGVADIVVSPGSVVHGVLWDVEELDSLNIREQHPHIYMKTQVEIELPSGATLEAVTYQIPPERHEGHHHPHSEYLELLEHGVRSGIPKLYFESLARDLLLCCS